MILYSRFVIYPSAILLIIFIFSFPSTNFLVLPFLPFYCFSRVIWLFLTWGMLCIVINFSSRLLSGCFHFHLFMHIWFLLRFVGYIYRLVQFHRFFNIFSPCVSELNDFDFWNYQFMAQMIYSGDGFHVLRKCEIHYLWNVLDIN